MGTDWNANCPFATAGEKKKKKAIRNEISLQTDTHTHSHTLTGLHSLPLQTLRVLIVNFM